MKDSNILGITHNRIQHLIKAHVMSRLLYKVMDDSITVVNSKEQVSSRHGKPLEIFYYAPYADEALAAVKDCICYSWLRLATAPQQYHTSFSQTRSSLISELVLLEKYKTGSYATQVDRDRLFLQGINCVIPYTKTTSILLGDRIWKNGELKVPQYDPLTGSTGWQDRATLAMMTQYITVAEMMQEDPSLGWK